MSVATQVAAVVSSFFLIRWLSAKWLGARGKDR